MVLQSIEGNDEGVCHSSNLGRGPGFIACEAIPSKLKLNYCTLHIRHEEGVTKASRPFQILEAACSILGNTIPTPTPGDTKDSQV